MDINIDKIINECGIEISIDNIIQDISKKISEYKSNRDENTLKEIQQLLQDRDKIYNFDKETISKYLNITNED